MLGNWGMVPVPVPVSLFAVCVVEVIFCSLVAAELGYSLVFSGLSAKSPWVKNSWFVPKASWVRRFSSSIDFCFIFVCLLRRSLWVARKGDARMYLYTVANQ